jgi:hypothetical protein
MIESKPQNSIELKARNIELTIQNQELQLAKHKAEIAAQKLNLFCDLSPIGHYLTDCDGKSRIQQKWFIFWIKQLMTY